MRTGRCETLRAHTGGGLIYIYAWFTMKKVPLLLASWMPVSAFFACFFSRSVRFCNQDKTKKRRARNHHFSTSHNFAHAHNVIDTGRLWRLRCSPPSDAARRQTWNQRYNLCVTSDSIPKNNAVCGTQHASCLSPFSAVVNTFSQELKKNIITSVNFAAAQQEYTQTTTTQT